MPYMYHILHGDRWGEAKEQGFYSPASLEAQGFIHFSKTEQILSVANSFYKGMSGLVILKVDCDKVEEEIKIEPPLEDPAGSLLFPHLYGKLNLDAVKEVLDFPCRKDGMFDLPLELLD